MKLTNEELLKMSDPNVPASVKNFICEQKMDKQEIAICRSMGVNPYEYLISTSMAP